MSTGPNLALSGAADGGGPSDRTEGVALSVIYKITYPNGKIYIG